MSPEALRMRYIGPQSWEIFVRFSDLQLREHARALKGAGKGELDCTKLKHTLTLSYFNGEIKREKEANGQLYSVLDCSWIKH